MHHRIIIDKLSSVVLGTTDVGPTGGTTKDMELAVQSATAFGRTCWPTMYASIVFSPVNAFTPYTDYYQHGKFISEALG